MGVRTAKPRAHSGDALPGLPSLCGGFEYDMKFSTSEHMTLLYVRYNSMDGS